MLHLINILSNDMVKECAQGSPVYIGRQKPSSGIQKMFKLKGLPLLLLLFCLGIKNSGCSVSTVHVESLHALQLISTSNCHYSHVEHNNRGGGTSFFLILTC